MEPRSCLVTGAFAHHGMPVRGLIRFTPIRSWVQIEGTYWANLAPWARLEPDGSFTVEVTATDNDAIMWTYLIESPAGDFEVYVPYHELGWSLKELIDDHHARARPTHRR